MIGPSFQVQEVETSPHRHLSVQGEIDIKTAPDLDAALAEGTTSLVLIDLSDVAFIDSTGLRVLATARDRFEAEGRTLVVCAPEDSTVVRTMRLAGLADDFRLIARPDELVRPE